MNQIMVAWTVHNAALAGADGNFDPASGAPPNWDEGWALRRIRTAFASR